MLKQIQLFSFNNIMIFKNLVLQQEIFMRTFMSSLHGIETASKLPAKKFCKMLKVILSCFFLFSQEPQVIKKKKNYLSCPWSHLLLIQPFSFKPIFFLFPFHPFFHNLPLGNKLTIQFLPAVALSRLCKGNQLQTQLEPLGKEEQRGNSED